MIVYRVPDGRDALRYRIHPRLVAGGMIRDAADADSLRRDFGITNVISVDDQYDDAGKWPDDKRERWPFEDNRRSIELGTLRKVDMAIAKAMRDPMSVLYLHCGLGRYRSPAMSYLTLQTQFQFSAMQAAEAVQAANQYWERTYVPVIDEFLKGLAT